MTITLRPFRDTDYDALISIQNALDPEHQHTVDELRYHTDARDPKIQLVRWVAEDDHHVIGAGLFMNMEWSYDPQRFFVGVDVLPERHGQGVGKALYNHLITELKLYTPTALLSQANETQPRSVRFLTDRGFVEDMRVWESKLDTTTFDWSPYAGIAARVAEHNITIKSLRDLVDDPERDRKVYDLMTAVGPDLPTTTPYTPPEFETVTARRNNDPNFLPEAYFVAVHNDQYIATSAVFNSQSNEHLWTGLTGTRREYRRKGIALALKLRVIRYAQEHGRRWIYTDNASTNRPMLAINERLGFQRMPAWIWFTKTLTEDT